MCAVYVGGWRIHEGGIYRGWAFARRVSMNRRSARARLCCVKIQTSDSGGAQTALADIPEPFALSVPWLHIIGWRR